VEVASSKTQSGEKNEKESNQEGTVDKKELFLVKRIRITKTSNSLAQEFGVKRPYHTGLQYGWLASTVSGAKGDVGLFRCMIYGARATCAH